MTQITRTIRNERGVAVPMVAVTLMTLLFCAGVGIDIGRLGVVADEVQNAADIAATAAAHQYAAPGGDSSTPRESAEEVLSKNEISNTSVGSTNLTLLEFGNYDVDNNIFTANLAPINAAHSRVEYLTHNLVFGLLGKADSLVAKEAIAAFSATGSGMPTIPLTVGDCLFDSGCKDDSCMPALTQVPNLSDNSAFTGYSSTASTSVMLHYFPSECDGDSPSSVPKVEVGDSITIFNGTTTQPLNKIQCMINNGITDVLLPVTRCAGGSNQAREVVGFAHFELLSVRTTGTNRGVTMKGTLSAFEGPGGGSADFGTGIITLVR